MLADAIDGAHWNINSVEAYQLQYDQALRYYPDEDGYAFTDVGPFRSSITTHSSQPLTYKQT